MTKEEAIKILQHKIQTMNDGAICCNFGIDKNVFEMAINALNNSHIHGKWIEKSYKVCDCPDSYNSGTSCPIGDNGKYQKGNEDKCPYASTNYIEVCSLCGKSPVTDTFTINYCPNCGAKMKEKN